MELRTATALEEVVRPFGSQATITFVGDDDGRDEVTYDQLAHDARRVAADLRRRGVSPGDEVAIALGSTRADVTAVLAVWQAGATLVSIPPPPGGHDETYRRGFVPMLARETCKLVLGSAELRDVLAPEIAVTGVDELDVECGAPLDDAPAAQHALVQFTSGSTGAPKGIVIRADALASHLEAMAAAVEYGDDDRGLSWLPLYHDMGLVGSTLLSVSRRMPLVLVSPLSFVRNPLSWPRMLAEHRATVTAAPNFAYRLLARILPHSSPFGDLGAVRVCLSGGERVSYSTLTRFADAAEPHGFRREALVPAYGLAEATLAVTAPPPGRGPVEGPRDSASCGTPVPGVEVRLRELDGTGSEERMIEVRGSSLFDGYLTPGGGLERRAPESWHRTNDVGVERDGELFVLGRADEVVVVRGQNVYAEDVEALAFAAAPAELLAVAAYRSPDQDDRFGLALEPMPGAGADPAELARTLQNAIAEALAANVAPVFVVHPLTIPRTTSRKVKRGECRRLHAEGWPEEALVATVG